MVNNEHVHPDLWRSWVRFLIRLLMVVVMMVRIMMMMPGAKIRFEVKTCLLLPSLACPTPCGPLSHPRLKFETVLWDHHWLKGLWTCFWLNSRSGGRLWRIGACAMLTCFNVILPFFLKMTTEKNLFPTCLWTRRAREIGQLDKVLLPCTTLYTMIIVMVMMMMMWLGWWWWLWNE